MDYQLVPPDDHRRNLAKKAIQTWKDHFVAVLSGTADNFPIHLWCQIIPQMERQLILLSQSNSNPKISTYAHLHGHHDYNERMGTRYIARTLPLLEDMVELCLNCWRSLCGCDGAEGGEHCAVDRAGIIQERAEDLLDSLLASFVERL